MARNLIIVKVGFIQTTKLVFCIQIILSKATMATIDQGSGGSMRSKVITTTTSRWRTARTRRGTGTMSTSRPDLVTVYVMQQDVDHRQSKLCFMFVWAKGI